jgi:hypothetical protein
VFNDQPTFGADKRKSAKLQSVCKACQKRGRKRKEEGGSKEEQNIVNKKCKVL